MLVSLIPSSENRKIKPNMTFLTDLILTTLTHLVEAIYASNTNPVINLMAAEGIKALGEGLIVIQQDAQNMEARYKALYGAWLCGLCLGAVDMALHHKLCHTLGGTFDLPHAETHVAILPHALAYNAPAAPQAMEMLADSLPESEGDAIRGINSLYRRLGIDVNLKSLGMPENGIDRAAELAVQDPYKNPAPLNQMAIRELIRRAWVGEVATGEWPAER